MILTPMHKRRAALAGPQTHLYKDPGNFCFLRFHVGGAPAFSNTFKLILLHGEKIKLPGIILLHGPNGSASVVTPAIRGKYRRISNLGTEFAEKARICNSFRMRTFANPSRQPL